MTPEEFMANPELAKGVMAGVMAANLIVGIIGYVYLAICFQFIAKKTNTANGWMAWVPILNIILALQIAKKPLWWIILLLIPFVNIIIGIILFMEIAKNRGKPAWVGILIIVPIANIIVPGYLAFSK